MFDLNLYRLLKTLKYKEILKFEKIKCTCTCILFEQLTAFSPKAYLKHAGIFDPKFKEGLDKQRSTLDDNLFNSNLPNTNPDSKMSIVYHSKVTYKNSILFMYVF